MELSTTPVPLPQGDDYYKVEIATPDRDGASYLPGGGAVFQTVAVVENS